MCRGEMLTECSNEDERVNAYLDNSPYKCLKGKIYKIPRYDDELKYNNSIEYCKFPEEGNVDPTQHDECGCFMCNLKYEKG